MRCPRVLAVALAAAVLSVAPAAAATPSGPALVPHPIVQIPTLLLHQVSDDPIRSAHGEDNVKEPWIAPAAFDDLLTRIERDGYRVVSMREALAIVDGRPPSATPGRRPLLLTFDDGYRSAWTVATPILRRHRAVATMFFEGQLTDVKPGRLTTADLRAMAASGVWTLESHGWIGHGNIVTDANGTRDPYWYANLMYLPSAHRLETVAEYGTRIRDDLARFKRTFEPALGTTIDLFAYPSGEFGQNAPLPPGGDPRARLEAGHSNAAGLTPALFSAVRAAGYRAAFAVSIPGTTTAASAASDPLAIPRLGVGATFDPAALASLRADGFEMPEVARGRFVDCAPIAASADGFVVGSVHEPLLFALDANGRRLARYEVPELASGRGERPALISGLDVAGDIATAVQQAGSGPGAQPTITRLRLRDGKATVLDRRALPSALNWTVGTTRLGGGLVAMTDDGRIYDLPGGAPRFDVPTSGSTDRTHRFVGLAAVGDRLVTYDRIASALVLTDARGARVAEFPLQADVRALGARGDRLFVVDGAQKRRIVDAYDLVGLP